MDSETVRLIAREAAVAAAREAFERQEDEHKKMMAETVKQTLTQLGISHDTVKLHVRHILSKLGLTSRVEAAVFAVEHRVASEQSDPSHQASG